MEDDINRFLYGDDTEAVQEFQPKRNTGQAVDDEVEPEAVAADQDDDDEFEIVIDGGGEEKRGLTSVSLGTTASQHPTPNHPNHQNNPLDLNAVPLYPGTTTTLLDVDLEEAFPGQEKPWRRPGADMTDYFNFGFNEFTWRQYCTKQKVLREEFGVGRKIVVERAQGVGVGVVPQQVQQIQQIQQMVPPPAFQQPPPQDRERDRYTRDGRDRPRRSRSREPRGDDYSRDSRDSSYARDSRDHWDGGSYGRRSNRR